MFKYKPPGGLYLEGRIHGGAYFRNFTVSCGYRNALFERPERAEADFEDVLFVSSVKTRRLSQLRWLSYLYCSKWKKKKQ